tara:strand:+ start:524 stop:685 length:162 start_codon:yes stop_codon:yes gene_type:complete
MSNDFYGLLFIFIWFAIWGIGFWLKTVAYLLSTNVVQKLFEDSTRRANEKVKK